MDLGNAKKTVAKFEERLNIEVKRQERINKIEDKDFRRGELSEKYIAKMLYEWND